MGKSAKKRTFTIVTSLKKKNLEGENLWKTSAKMAAKGLQQGPPHFVGGFLGGGLSSESRGSLKSPKKPQKAPTPPRGSSLGLLTVSNSPAAGNSYFFLFGGRDPGVLAGLHRWVLPRVQGDQTSTAFDSHFDFKKKGPRANRSSSIRSSQNHKPSEKVYVKISQFLKLKNNQPGSHLLSVAKTNTHHPPTAPPPVASCVRCRFSKEAFSSERSSCRAAFRRRSGAVCMEWFFSFWDLCDRDLDVEAV